METLKHIGLANWVLLIFCGTYARYCAAKVSLILLVKEETEEVEEDEEEEEAEEEEEEGEDKDE